MNQVEQLLQLCRSKGLRLRTAESCTAGAIAAQIASVAGASDVFDRGWVTYSNAAKTEMLGVDARLIASKGAVSREVAEAMAVGGSASGTASDGVSTVCLAVSGIAGPAGGSAEKPVGTVWVAICMPNRRLLSQCFQFSGGRAEIQAAAVAGAIRLLIEEIGKGASAS